MYCDAGGACGRSRARLSAGCSCCTGSVPSLTETIHMFERAMESAPAEAEVPSALGVLHNLSRDYNAAVEAFRRALEVRPRLATRSRTACVAPNRLQLCLSERPNAQMVCTRARMALCVRWKLCSSCRSMVRRTWMGLVTWLGPSQNCLQRR